MSTDDQPAPPQEDESLEAFLAAADLPVPALPHASEVVARAARLEAAARAAAESNGGTRPVDSGSRVHPQLRTLGVKGK